MSLKIEIYRCKTESEAIDWMENQSGRKFQLCVFTSTQDYNYYISRDGILYSCHYCHTLKRYESYKMSQRKQQLIDGKRNNEIGIFYKLTSNKEDKIVLGAKLVYCTYVLGYWDEHITIKYKDCNRFNIKLDNLYEYKKIDLTYENAIKMNSLTNVYKQHFKPIQNYVKFISNISIDDAKDCTQEAFLILSSKIEEKKIRWFVYYWATMASKMSRKYLERRIKSHNIELMNFGTHDKQYEVNLLELLNDERQRDVMGLISQGYTQLEAGEILNLTKRQIQISQHNASKILRDYLRTDKDIIEIYAK